VLTSVDSPGRGGVVLHVEDRWFANSLLVGRDVIPAKLRARVASGAPAQQRFVFGGEAWLAVGVPIPRVQAEFFEAFSLAEVDRTLETLSFSLIGAALLTTLAGAAVGRWASARVIRPLSSVSDAARAIAEGSLDIHLDVLADRDLAPLVDSFNRMVDALRERISRDARFASDVSHELRSPLTTLSTSVGVLQARSASSAWSRTCSRSRATTRGLPSSSSKRSICAISSATRSVAPATASRSTSAMEPRRR
jgi:signal transduction histidine kinase